MIYTEAEIAEMDKVDMYDFCNGGESRTHPGKACYYCLVQLEDGEELYAEKLIEDESDDWEAADELIKGIQEICWHKTARSRAGIKRAYGLLVEALLSMTNCHEKSPEYRDGLEDYLINMNFHKLVDLLEAQNYTRARGLIDNLGRVE